jgi:endoglucanase
MKSSPSAVLLFLCCLAVWLSTGHTASSLETLALRRGVSMGNMLEAPNEGDWGLYVQEKYFGVIKEAGFDFVRLPVAWGDHAGQSEPYTIDPRFLSHIDEVVKWALKRNLRIIIDFHRYNQVIATGAGQENYPNLFDSAMARFLGIWQQLSEHYESYPPEALFELLSEPKTHCRLRSGTTTWHRLSVSSVNRTLCAI